VATIWVTGFEHGVLPPAHDYFCGQDSAFYFDDWGGSGVHSVVKRTGNCALELYVLSPSDIIFDSPRLERNFSALSLSTVVGRFYFRVSSLPDSTAFPIWQWGTNNYGYGEVRINVDGTVSSIIGFDTESEQVSTGTVSVGTWYRIDFKIDLTSSVATFSVKLQGETLSTVSMDTGANDTFTTSVFGIWASANTNECSLFIDDVIFSDSAADYPFGEGGVVALVPGSDGTHNSGTVVKDEGNNIIDGADHTAWDRLNTVPLLDMFSALTYVQQTDYDPSKYAEVNFEDTAETIIHGVQAVVSCGGSGAFEVGGTYIVGDGTDTIFQGDISSGAVCHRSITIPVGGWTVAKVNALKGRVGFVDDWGADSRWFGFILEIAYGTESAPTDPEIYSAILVTLSENVGVDIQGGEITLSVADLSGISESISIVIFSALAQQFSAIDVVRVVESVAVSTVVAYGMSTYVVPAGVTKLSIEAWGMGQAGENGGATYGGKGGGGGAYVQRTVDVTPGETLTLFKGSYPNAVGVDTTVYRDYGGPGQTLLLLAKSAYLYNGGDSASSAGDERYSGGDYDWPAENTYGMGGGGGADARYLSVGEQGKNGIGITGGSSWRPAYPRAGGDGGIADRDGSAGEVGGGGGGGGKIVTRSPAGGVGGAGEIIICAIPAIGVTGVSVADVPTVNLEVPNTFTVSRSNLISVSDSSSLIISEVICSRQDSIGVQESAIVYVSGEVVVVYLPTSDIIVVSESVIVYISATPVAGVAVYVKVGGGWIAVSKVWVKAEGVWKESTPKVKASGNWEP
jgi:hypothetical protein